MNRDHESHDVRQRYTYEKKYHALQLLETESIESVEKKLGINNVTLRSWIKNAEEIRKLVEGGSVKIHGKKCVVSKFAIIGEKLYAWYLNAKAKNLPISGNILQRESLRISRRLGINDFTAHTAWINKWKQRKGIRLGTFKHDKQPASRKKLSSKKKPLENKRPKQFYTFDVKLNALKLIEASSIAEVSKQLNISRDVLRDWKRKRREIEEMCQDTSTMTRKRFWHENNPVIEERLYEWYLKVVQEKVMILSEDILREQALRIAEEINDTEFTAPIAWVKKWKKDRKIRVSDYNESLGIFPFVVKRPRKPKSNGSLRIKTENTLDEQGNNGTEDNFGTVDDSNNYHFLNGFNSNEENTTMAVTNLQNVGNSMSKLNTKDFVEQEFHKSNGTLHIKQEVTTEEETDEEINRSTYNVHGNFAVTYSFGEDNVDTKQALDQIDIDTLDLKNRKPKAYSSEEKMTILKWLEKTPIIDLAIEVGVNKSVISKWRKRVMEIEEMDQQQSPKTDNTNRRSLRQRRR